VLQQAKSQSSGNETVTVSMIPFAGDALTDMAVEQVDLDRAIASLTADVICRHVTQDEKFGLDPANPGALSERQAGSDPSTNYAAAFAAAENALNDDDGKNLVYFISDGEPTSGAADPAQAGIAAGQDLLASREDVVLNGLLLGAGGAASRDIMEKITGDATHVRVAADAGSLASEILKFPAITLDPKSLQVNLTGASVAGPLTVESFVSDGDGWVFQTTGVKLLANQSYEMNASVRDSQGRTLTLEQTITTAAP
jgi:hypothetical protein